MYLVGNFMGISHNISEASEVVSWEPVDRVYVNIRVHHNNVKSLQNEIHMHFRIKVYYGAAEEVVAGEHK